MKFYVKNMPFVVLFYIILANRVKIIFVYEKRTRYILHTIRSVIRHG